MYELFADQINSKKHVTYDVWENLKHKNYYNGDAILIGDQILFATMCIAEDKNGDLNIEIIQLNESHFDQYEIDTRFNIGRTKGLPVIKLKPL